MGLVVGERRLTLGAAASFCVAIGACSDTAPDCWRDVDAAYQRLETRGPYRAETISVVEGRKSDTSTYEFVPPDRRRVVFIDGLGRIWLEAIKITTRVWARHGQSGWYESPAGSTLAALFGGAPERVPVTCLGVIEFSGKTYIGYQARYNPKPLVTIAHATLEPSKAEPSVLPQQELRMTILVDRETALVVHEIVAAQDELAAPTSRTNYTFSKDIVIDAPVR